MYIIRSVVIAILSIVEIFAIFLLLYSVYHNPFHYPYFNHAFNISGKRNVNLEDWIDHFLNKQSNWDGILRHETKIQEWELMCEEYIRTHHFKKIRYKQFCERKDKEHTYRFDYIRMQTRYVQQNYIKSPYKMAVITNRRTYSYKQLNARYSELAKINHACSLAEYNTKNQRKNLTPGLRKQIILRDQYTCQMCGKQMPDGVGLQIDHIIPIARGGKTISSNLRVLCSNCNAKKGSKLDEEILG